MGASVQRLLQAGLAQSTQRVYASGPDIVMMWAVCCVGFFRSGELVVSDSGAFDPNQHLSFRDVTVDDPKHPNRIFLRIKQSKTDPFRKGITICLSKTGQQLCPVAALLSYLVMRGKEDGPLRRRTSDAGAAGIPLKESTVMGWPGPREIWGAQLPHWSGHDSGNVRCSS